MLRMTSHPCPEETTICIVRGHPREHAEKPHPGSAVDACPCRRAQPLLGGHSAPAVWGMLLLLGLAAFFPWATAYAAANSPWAPEVPFTVREALSARALGMGGAYLAAAEDADALFYNPASLARVKRVEVSAGLLDRSVRFEVATPLQSREARRATTDLSRIVGAYPVPTYRGSFVLAAGFGTRYLTDHKYLRRGGAATDGTTEDERESIDELGSCRVWSIGFGFDAAPDVSLGASVSWLSGNRNQEWAFEEPGAEAAETIDADLRGLTASLGAVGLAGSVRVGATIDLPVWLDEEASVYQAGEEYEAEDSMRLPFRTALGIAVDAGRLTLVAEGALSDWAKMDYEGPVRYVDQSGRTLLAYGKAWEARVGGEMLVDAASVGLKIRCGAALETLPYRVVLDGIDAEGENLSPRYARADYVSQRWLWTAGLGVLIGESLSVDVAWAQAIYRRTGRIVEEKAKERRLLATVSFRLE